MKSILAIAALALTLSSPPVFAENGCQEQLIRSVERQMRPIDRSLDVRALSCSGLANVYSILQDSDKSAFQPQRFKKRAAIRQVFRREGLL